MNDIDVESTSTVYKTTLLHQFFLLLFAFHDCDGTTFLLTLHHTASHNPAGEF